MARLFLSAETSRELLPRGDSCSSSFALATDGFAETLVRDRSQRVVLRRARRRRDRAQVRLDRPADALDQDDAVEQGCVVIGVGSIPAGARIRRGLP